MNVGIIVCITGSCEQIYFEVKYSVLGTRTYISITLSISDGLNEIFDVVMIRGFFRVAHGLVVTMSRKWQKAVFPFTTSSTFTAGRKSEGGRASSLQDNERSMDINIYKRNKVEDYSALTAGRERTTGDVIDWWWLLFTTPFLFELKVSAARVNKLCPLFPRKWKRFHLSFHNNEIVGGLWPGIFG